MSDTIEPWGYRSGHANFDDAWAVGIDPSAVLLGVARERGAGSLGVTRSLFASTTHLPMMMRPHRRSGR